MKILFSDDYIVNESLVNKSNGLVVFGDYRLQIVPVNQKEQVLCFTYDELITVTIEVLKEVMKTRILVFDIETGTVFKLNLNIQTLKQYFELQVELTVEELKQLFAVLDKQEIVVHDPVHLREFYLEKNGSLQAYVAKKLLELYPL